MIFFLEKSLQKDTIFYFSIKMNEFSVATINYPFCRSQLVFKTFRHSTSQILIKVLKD